MWAIRGCMHHYGDIKEINSTVTVLPPLLVLLHTLILLLIAIQPCLATLLKHSLHEILSTKMVLAVSTLKISLDWCQETHAMSVSSIDMYEVSV